jgi:phage terminase large subunit-like protein
MPSDPNSQKSWIASLSPEAREKLKTELSPEEQAILLYDWRRWARPKQIAPDGEWIGWLQLGGRGGGKTRSGAEWVRENVESGAAKRIALIGETSADGKDVMVNGDSGIIACSPPWNKPIFTTSSSGGRPKLTWPSGAIATLYDAREPDQLRGPQFDLAWLDELAKYRYAQLVFDNLMMGLRLGENPRWLATTTPRPIALIKALMKDPLVKVTRYSSTDNIQNLALAYRRNVIERYAGTRLGRQEIEAEILEDVPGALWSRRNLDENRVRIEDVPPIVRLVVSIDPAITSGDSANETGIIVAGIAGTLTNQHGYTLEDMSLRGSPDQWARRAVSAYRKYEADKIVAEANQGGEMVERVIRSVAPDVPVKLVRATRGKYIRAEPISALYEQNRISHVGTLPELEDQMIAFTPESASDRLPGESPDRVDALVWAYAELFEAMTVPVRAEHDDDSWRSRSTNYGPSGTTGYGES